MPAATYYPTPDFSNIQTRQDDDGPFKIDTSRHSRSYNRGEHGSTFLKVKFRRPNARLVLGVMFWSAVLAVSGVGLLQSSLWGLSLIGGAVLVAGMVAARFAQYARGTAQVMLTEAGIRTSLEFIEWGRIEDVSVKETRAGNLSVDDVHISVQGTMLPTIIAAEELEYSGVELAAAIRAALQQHAGWSADRRLDWNVDGRKTSF